MPRARHNQRAIRPTSTRPALAGASVLLVLGLLVSASVEPLRTGREASRSEPTERVSVRELTATLAKAVRTLVETASQKPVACITPRPTTWDPQEGVFALRIEPCEGVDAGAPRLRHGLLDLPPPVRA